MENLPEIFYYPLKIYEQINFGLLRPHGLEVKRALVVNRNIPKGLKNPKTLEEYETSLEQFFKIYPDLLRHIDLISKKGDYKKITSTENGFFGTFENLIDITFPKTFDVTSSFYFYLITNEAKRFLTLLNYYLRNSPKIEKINLLQRNLIVVSGQITNSIENIIHQDDHLFSARILGPNSQIKKIYRYTYTVLILALIRLYFEIIYVFSPLVDDQKKTIEELLLIEVETLDVEKLSQEIDFGLTILKAKELAEAEHFEVMIANGVLRELYAQKDHKINQRKWEEAVAALENRSLLWGIKVDLPMQFFGSLLFAEEQFKKVQEDCKNEIEKYITGKDRLNKIEDLISKLKLELYDLLDEEVKIKNSIPRRLLEWLNEQKELYRDQNDKKFTGFENYDNSGKKNQPKTKDDEKISFECFTYVQLKDNPDKLDNIFLKLIEYYPEIGHRFISENTDKRNFRKIFSGSMEEIKNPIFWMGFENELKYLIDLIHNDYELVINLKQKQYEVMAKCFVNKDGKMKWSNVFGQFFLQS